MGFPALLVFPDDHRLRTGEKRKRNSILSQNFDKFESQMWQIINLSNLSRYVKHLAYEWRKFGPPRLDLIAEEPLDEMEGSELARTRTVSEDSLRDSASGSHP